MCCPHGLCAGRCSCVAAILLHGKVVKLQQGQSQPAALWTLSRTLCDTFPCCQHQMVWVIVLNERCIGPIVSSRGDCAHTPRRCSVNLDIVTAVGFDNVLSLPGRSTWQALYCLGRLVQMDACITIGNKAVCAVSNLLALLSSAEQLGTVGNTAIVQHQAPALVGASLKTSHTQDCSGQDTSHVPHTPQLRRPA